MGEVPFVEVRMQVLKGRLEEASSWCGKLIEFAEDGDVNMQDIAVVIHECSNDGNRAAWERGQVGWRGCSVLLVGELGLG